MSSALPAGYGSSHGETVGRYDTGLGPTPLWQRAGSMQAVNERRRPPEDKETRPSRHRHGSSYEEYCSRTNGSDRLLVELVLVAVRSGHDAIAGIPGPPR